VSQRLNILCIMFKIIVFFVITLFTQLYEMAFYSHVERTYLTQKTSLIQPHFIEVPVPS